MFLKKFTMKKIILSFFTLLFCFAMITNTQAQTKSKKMIRHVVLFKFKDTSSAQEVKMVEDAFVALKGKIKLIKDFEWGTNNSPENLNQGLTHCFLASFASEKDRDDYLVHPDHKAFVAVLLPHLDKVTVIDYWVK